MHRGPTGFKQPISTVGEPCFAFVPHPLPPTPAVAWSAPLFQKASVSLGRLAGVTSLLPDPHLFLYSYIRKEAVLSSQIEGTQSSLSDLLLFENEPPPACHARRRSSTFPTTSPRSNTDSRA
jgi:hypothetical protein